MKKSRTYGKSLVLSVVFIAFVANANACMTTRDTASSPSGPPSNEPDDASTSDSAVDDTRLDSPAPLATPLPIDSDAVVRVTYEKGTFAQGGCLDLGGDTIHRIVFDLPAGTARAQLCKGGGAGYVTDAGSTDETVAIDVAKVRTALGRLRVRSIAEVKDAGACNGADGPRYTMFLEQVGASTPAISPDCIDSNGHTLDFIAVEGFRQTVSELYELASIKQPPFP